MNAQTKNRDWLLNSDTDARAVARYYDDWADDYDRELRAWNYRSPDEAARLLAGYAAPEARVLDAGCGTGLSGHALVAAGFSDITGVDISEASLRIAAERGLYTALHPANLQELPLPFEADSFDALTCVGVLTYVADLDEVFGEFCRLVRPGGHIVFTCREDLFHQRGYAEAIGALVSRGAWRELYRSAPSPYLPGNEAFAQDIQVLYLAYQASS